VQLWYALRVRSCSERLVIAALDAQSLEYYWPTYELDGRRREQPSIRAYFPGYVFSRFEFAERRPIVQIAQVIDVLGFGGHAMPIPDTEIAAVKQILATPAVNAAPAAAYQLGDRVIVRYGPLRGLEGYVVHIKNATRLVVNVSMLNRAISAEVDGDSLEVLARQAA
jgi:transcription antitermination factor NusG